MTEVLWDVALGIAITTVTGRLMLGDGEGGPSFLQTMAAVSAGAMPGIIDYTNGAAFRFPSRVDLDLSPAGPDRMNVPGHLPESVRRSLLCATAPTVARNREYLSCRR